MTTTRGLLKWSEAEPAVEISTAVELDQQLDKLMQDLESKSPVILTIRMHDQEILFGLGSEWSFAHVESISHKPPYHITRGCLPAEGTIDFYLHGNHHTAIPRQNLIPTQQARIIVREFFETGRRSENVEWEEI